MLRAGDETLQTIEQTACQQRSTGAALRFAAAFRERSQEREIVADAVLTHALVHIHAVPSMRADALAPLATFDVRGYRRPFNTAPMNVLRTR